MPPANKPVENDGTSYIDPAHTVMVINGKECKFHSVSILVACKLRNVAKPLLAAIAMLYQGAGQENGVKHTKKRFANAADGTTGEEEIEEAQGIDSKLAEVKIIEREKAIRQMVDAFSDDKNARVVAEFILDTLREGDVTTARIDQFLRGDIATFKAYMTGALKANVSVLGPLGGRVLASFQDPALAEDSQPQ